MQPQQHDINAFQAPASVDDFGNDDYDEVIEHTTIRHDTFPSFSNNLPLNPSPNLAPPLLPQHNPDEDEDIMIDVDGL